MNFEDVFRLLIGQFEKYNIRVALIGGMAMHTAGHSRATQDIDFLVAKDDVAKLKKLMASFGYDVLHESEDVLNFAGRLKELGQVDFLIAHRKYTQIILQKAAQQKVLDGQFQIKVVRVEDQIGLKVQSSSNDPKRYHQDLADIEALMTANQKTLDWEVLREYFGLFDRVKELEDIRKKIQDAH